MLARGSFFIVRQQQEKRRKDSTMLSFQSSISFVFPAEYRKASGSNKPVMVGLLERQQHRAFACSTRLGLGDRSVHEVWNRHAVGTRRPRSWKRQSRWLYTLCCREQRDGPRLDWNTALIRASRWLSSTQGQLVIWALLVWLVISGRIGVIFDSFLILFALLSLAPVVGAFALRWWISANVREGSCPNCRFPVTGIVGREFRCPSCAQRILAEKNGTFVLSEDARSAVINIEAREIDAKDK
jgi:hypothetical protein